MATSGLSTGALIQQREDWEKAINTARIIYPDAIELNLHGDRLAHLVVYLEEQPHVLDDFQYVSVHLNMPPSEGWEAHLQTIFELPIVADTLVVHADAVTAETIPFLQPLGSQVGIENTDGMQGEDHRQCLIDAFASLPQAHFVLDIAHTHQLDPNDTLARVLIHDYRSRLVHLHCSVLRGDTRHWSPLAGDAGWMAALLDTVPDTVRIWEQLPLFQPGSVLDGPS